MYSSKKCFPLIGGLENTSSPPDAKFTRLEGEINCKVKLKIL